MDILRFIPSSAMREYLQKINYKFNALECAWLVYQCKTTTLAEKHATWQEIIDTLPDCEIVSKHLPHKSLHKFLKQYMEIENRSIQQFFEPKENAFYRFSWNYVIDDYKPYYKTVDECFSAATKFKKENNSLFSKEAFCNYIHIDKLHNGCNQERVNFSPDGQIISTLPPESSFSEEEYRLYFVFRHMQFDFPTPFKKSDILFDRTNREYPNHNLMVFEKMDVAENGAHCAYGYIMDDGHIMRDGFDCLNLEYYTSDRFENEYRALDYVRKYLLGELSLTGLMNKYHQVLCEEQAKNTSFYFDLLENDIVDEKWKQNWFFEQTENI